TCASSRPGATSRLSATAPAATRRMSRGARSSARARRRRCCCAEVAADEFEHRAIPDDDVARLQDPLVLVREDQQLTRHAVVLQRFEEIQRLVHPTAVVALAMDDEGRRAPLRYMP